jgi:hypothetical protein
LAMARWVDLDGSNEALVSGLSHQGIEALFSSPLNSETGTLNL